MLNNEYRNLLQYLEKQNVSSPPIRVVKRPEVKPLPSTAPKKVEKTKTAREEASVQTKKLIEECQEIYSEVPLPEPVKDGSKGFSVAKLEELMRAKLVDEHKKLQSYERPYISVSELYRCLRQNYYARMKYPVDVKEQYRFAYLYLINQVGNAVHDVLQSIYGFSEVEKTIVSEHFKVKGRVDALKEGYLYEFKTIDLEKFKNKYIPEHCYQSMIYAYILNTEYDYKIETVTIVYIPRNLKRVIPFDIPYNSELAESFLKHALTLRDCLSVQRVPEPINATNEQCRYCIYKKFCEKDACQLSQPFAKKAPTKKKKKDEKPEAVFVL